MFEPKKTVSQYSRKPSSGQFSIEGNELRWQSCREQFARDFHKDCKEIYFSHENNFGEHIACFISKIEDILIQGSGYSFEKTKFSETNYSFVLCVYPSGFWMDCNMKRSLFTIFLRCGLCYNKDLDNFEDALYKNKYVKKSIDSIERFLFGYTQFSTSYRPQNFKKGWVHCMSRKDQNQICKSLVLPKEIKKKPVFFGSTNIWS